LKKIIGIFDLKLKQASTKEVETKQSILVPGCNITHIDKVIDFLYPGQNIDEIELKKVHPSYLTRNYIITAVLTSIVVILGIIFQTNFTIYIGLLLGALLTFMSWLSYRKLSYGFNQDLILLKGGAFGDKNILTPIYKIQSIERKQSPFQRRKGLASIVLYNASGSETIPHIPVEEANHIYNNFLMKVELDTRKWM
jgi:putative membrane protein